MQRALLAFWSQQPRHFDCFRAVKHSCFLKRLNPLLELMEVAVG